MVDGIARAPSRRISESVMRPESAAKLDDREHGRQEHGRADGELKERCAAFISSIFLRASHSFGLCKLRTQNSELPSSNWRLRQQVAHRDARLDINVERKSWNVDELSNVKDRLVLETLYLHRH